MTEKRLASVEDSFDLEEWVMEYDLEETRNDPHYSIYYTPEYEEEPSK